jgi:hypothetical protein
MLGGARGQLRIVMRGDVKNFGIVGKIVIQQEKRLQRRLGLVDAHGAFGRGHGGTVFQVFVRDACQRFSKLRESLVTLPFGSEINGVFDGGGGNAAGGRSG